MVWGLRINHLAISEVVALPPIASMINRILNENELISVDEIYSNMRNDYPEMPKNRITSHFDSLRKKHGDLFVEDKSQRPYRYHLKRHSEAGEKPDEKNMTFNLSIFEALIEKYAKPRWDPPDTEWRMRKGGGEMLYQEKVIQKASPYLTRDALWG